MQKSKLFIITVIIISSLNLTGCKAGGKVLGEIAEGLIELTIRVFARTIGSAIEQSIDALSSSKKEDNQNTSAQQTQSNEQATFNPKGSASKKH
ncbi:MULTISPECIES: hypothetical protein [unclassified Acinetobacter]|uniref:hypothetical protein n=1 Tax=unclassified Acinetobacter TaxID=196816 RepID=UPI0035B8F9C8